LEFVSKHKIHCNPGITLIMVYTSLAKTGE
jgi:hypothetical protein